MAHNVIPSHSRGHFLEELGEVVTKLGFKGKQDLGNSHTLHPSAMLRVQIMMGDNVESLKRTLDSEPDLDYRVNGVTTYELAQAFGDEKAIELLNQHLRTKKSHHPKS